MMIKVVSKLDFRCKYCTLAFKKGILHIRCRNGRHKQRKGTSKK